MSRRESVRSDVANLTRNLVSGLLFGVGAFLDETIFHQLLHWHHVYDKSTTSVGLVSDGLLHYDGLIQHKLMKLHQIRYPVNVTPNGLGWNIIAAIADGRHADARALWHSFCTGARWLPVTRCRYHASRPLSRIRRSPLVIGTIDMSLIIKRRRCMGKVVDGGAEWSSRLRKTSLGIAGGH